jgi:hypothetical protein
VKTRAIAGCVTIIVGLAMTAAPAVAQGGEQSCVGWFASTTARADGAAFGAMISRSARNPESEPNFGAGTVAPFAHLPLEICQG